LIHPSYDGTPLFNGDPLLHRLDFGGGEVKITSRIPKTPCYYTDQACHTDDQWTSYGYANHGLARLSFGVGFLNEVNTAVSFNSEWREWIPRHCPSAPSTQPPIRPSIPVRRAGAPSCSASTTASRSARPCIRSENALRMPPSTGRMPSRRPCSSGCSRWPND
jgi:hypothetical protein